MFFFFFSSRRRHTRSDRDWSSDVCSSDLGAAILTGPVAADQVPIGTTLSGGNEVPGPGDPNGSGTAALTVDTASGQICYQLNVSGLSSHPIAAQIQHGEVGISGQAGPVTINLTPPTNGSSSDCVTIDTGLAANGLATYPFAYYVTIVTTEFPQGAVRGQLGAANSDHGTANNDHGVSVPDHGVSVPEHTDDASH